MNKTRLSEIRKKVADERTAWYGLVGGREDVKYLLSLVDKKKV